MSEQSFWRRNWKLILNIATVVALLGLVVAIHEQLLETLENLKKVNIWFLLLLPLIQLGNYHSQTKLYQGLFAALGTHFSYKKLFKASLEINFINHVFPSGGVSGISYFGMRLKNKEVTGSKATLVQLMKVVMLILSFELLLIIGLLILGLNNKANNFTIMITTLITTLMVLGTLLFGFIIGSKSRINTAVKAITKAINWLVYVFVRKRRQIINSSRIETAFDDMHNNYLQLRSKWRELKQPLIWALAANVTEVLSVYVVYMAFGEFVNIGAVILAYSVANFAGLVSVMPGGVGIYEALMTGVLVASGVPAAVSLPVTVMYRVLNTLIQVPPGYVLYHRAIREHGIEVDPESGKVA